MSGTITVHDGGQRVPRVAIEASGAGYGSTLLFSPADRASWSLTLPARQEEEVSSLCTATTLPATSFFIKSLPRCYDFRNGSADKRHSS
ncbi:MAG: hypothetical protein LBB61_05845 [Treponema sp.]|nr:hypothetical protein [Treponema sp.]